MGAAITLLTLRAISGREQRGHRGLGGRAGRQLGGQHRGGGPYPVRPGPGYYPSGGGGGERRGVAGGPALASSNAISTVAFQVRNSFAVKWPPARSAM